MNIVDNTVKYFSEFKVLKTVSKDFWLTNAVNFFQCLAYFSMITIITLYLSSNVGFSDLDSSKWYGFFSLYVVAFIFAVGPICDIIGIKKTMFIGLGFLILAHAGLTFFPISLELQEAGLAVKVSLIVLSLGTAFIGAPINTALRRFIKREHRATGFNIYYLIMNIGAIFVNVVVVTVCRWIWGTTGANLWILGMGMTTTIIALICATFINEDNYAEENERMEHVEQRRPLEIFSEVWRERPFQKLIFFLIITIGVRLVFTNQILIMPKYYTRTLTEDFELGIANGINPFVIVVGLIALIPIINKYSTVKLMLLGMSISAFSLLIICIPPQWMMSLPFINSISAAYLTAIVLQIAIFAAGELIFMPRFQEYIATIAPKDKVASYMALSALPTFISKPVNGFISGILITYFCFDGIRAKIDTGLLDYDKSPEFMWMIYTVLAIMSPLLIIAFRKFFLDLGGGQVAAPEDNPIQPENPEESPLM